MEKLISIKEVAELTALSVSHLYKRTSAGTIPFYKVGKRVLFRLSEIDGWLEAMKGEDKIQKAGRLQSSLDQHRRTYGKSHAHNSYTNSSQQKVIRER